MIKGMKIWYGLELSNKEHERLINDVHEYMKKNKKATYYYTSTGDTFVIGLRDVEAGVFEIYDCTIESAGVFENEK